MSKTVCVQMGKDLFGEKWQGLKEKFANSNSDILNCSWQEFKRRKSFLAQKVKCPRDDNESDR